MTRRYIKRVWRVPKDRGAVAYFAALVVKALVKHGWPARATQAPQSPYAFQVEHIDYDLNDTPEEFWRAVEIAARIVARTHRVDIDYLQGLIALQHRYVVTSSGFFKKDA